MTSAESATRTIIAGRIYKLQRNKYLACVAGALILLVSLGIRQAFGVFLIPITHDTGWNRATFSIAVALMQLFWGFSQPFLVFFAERKLGFGRSIFVGSVIFGAGCILMYAAPMSSGLFIFAMGLIGGAAGANSFPIVLATIGRRFPQQSKHQSIAFGVVSSFGSFGQCCFLPIARQMLETIGWRWAMIVMGAIMLSLAPLAYFLQSVPAMPPISEDKTVKTIEEPAIQKHEQNEVKSFNQLVSKDKQNTEVHKAPNTKVALKQAFSSPTFLLITFGYSVCGFHVSFLSTHLPAYLQDNGINVSIAAWTLSVIGLCSMAGSIATGFLCTRFKSKYILAGNFFLRAVIITIFLWVPISLATIFIFSVVFGFLWLSTVPVTTKFIGDSFGHKYLGTLASISFVGHQIGAFLGAYIGGVVYDTMHEYSRMWFASLGLSIIAIIAYIIIPEAPKYNHP